MMAIRVCVAGATGWTGRAVTGALLGSSDFQLVGAIARRQVGVDIGEALRSWQSPCAHRRLPGRGAGGANRCAD